jgi:hypothetical protein
MVVGAKYFERELVLLPEPADIVMVCVFGTACENAV